jgi:dipeptidyl aminopeptidase/acylaminoacyl peptidase
MLIQHGTADESCPVEWSQFTVNELQRLGKNYQYIEYDGYPHVFWNQNWNTAILDANNFVQPFLQPEA